MDLVKNFTVCWESVGAYWDAWDPGRRGLFASRGEGAPLGMVSAPSDAGGLAG